MLSFWAQQAAPATSRVEDRSLGCWTVRVPTGPIWAERKEKDQEQPVAWTSGCWPQGGRASQATEGAASPPPLSASCPGEARRHGQGWWPEALRSFSFCFFF